MAASCENVHDGLRVLTLNLLFSQFETRDENLERVADFIAAQSRSQQQVHLILLQEVVGGLLAGTEDSSQDLRDKLAERGELYELRSRYETGVPGILVVKNAILSSCPILFSLAKTLSIANEDTGDFTIPVRRQVTMVRIRIPHIGNINVYNTHLCADCMPADRLHQVKELLEFLNTIEGLFGADDPLILGGDFNIDLNTPDEAPQDAYALLIENRLVDTYAEANDCTNCCSTSNIERFDGCTSGIFDDSGTPKRIDYIFIREEQWSITESKVVFNNSTNGGEVSNHAGVLTTLNVPKGAAPLVALR
jgi:maltose 6'-phosphate phosphatase